MHLTFLTVNISSSTQSPFHVWVVPYFLIPIPSASCQRKPFVMCLPYVLQHRYSLVKHSVGLCIFSSIKGFVNPISVLLYSFRLVWGPIHVIWFIVSYCYTASHSVIYCILFIHSSGDGYTGCFQLPIAIYTILV